MPIDKLAAAAALLPPCPHTRTSDAIRQFIALHEQPELARSCLVEQLSQKRAERSAPAWTLAAAALPKLEYSSAFLSKAKGLLNDKASSKYPASYDLFGPMPIGKNEVDGDPLAALGGAFQHWVTHHNGSGTAPAAVTSELVAGGRVTWRTVRTEPNGLFRVAWPEVPWQQLMQAMTQRAVLEVQSWAMGTLAVAEAGFYRLDCKGVHKVQLYSALAPHLPPRVVAGDIYGNSPHGSGGLGVGFLPVGAYILALRVRCVVQATPSCALIPSSSAYSVASAGGGEGPPSWSVGSPEMVPDAIRQTGRDRICGGYVALPVRNSGANGWLRNVTAHGRDVESEPRSRAAPFDVAPGQVRLLPVKLRLSRELTCPFSTTVEVRLALERGAEPGGGSSSRSSSESGRLGAMAPATAKVRVANVQCRTPSQSIVCTHLDQDGAVAAAAVICPLHPELCDHSRGCPAILALHGTSRPVRDSADAFKFKPEGSADADFTFGVERFWIVAPTRHGAHNWEEGGRLSALRALANMNEATAAAPGLAPFVPIDTERLLIAGHSMGGHGAWVVALQAASRVLGVASVSGWAKKETYGDSNFLFDQSVSDISSSYVEPELEALLRASVGSNHVELHLPLLADVPHLVRAGDADMTVHPFWARRIMRLANGYANAQLTELPGKEHWWWDTHRPNDGGAMNDDEMRRFFNTTWRGPPGARPPLPSLPEGYLLVAHSVGSFEGRNGWQLLQARVPGKMASVRLYGVGSRSSELEDATVTGDAAARRKPRQLRLRTRNVRRLRVPPLPPGSTLQVDDDPVPVPAPPPTSEDTWQLGVHGVQLGGDETWELCRLLTEDTWQACTRASWREAERSPATAGPIRQVFQAPFTLVYGAGASTDRSADGGFAGHEGEMLAVYLSNLFLHTCAHSPPILPDVAIKLVSKEPGSVQRREVGADATTLATTLEVPGEHLVLIGGPALNLASAAVAQYWREVGHAVAWTSTGALSIGGCEMPSAGVGALLLGPKPGGGLALIIEGDSRGLRDAIAAGEPTIPPMARSPFSNTLPDYIVTGPDFQAKGYGGILAAGFFTPLWEVAEASSFRAMDCRRSSHEEKNRRVATGDALM